MGVEVCSCRCGSSRCREFCGCCTRCGAIRISLPVASGAELHGSSMDKAPRNTFQHALCAITRVGGQKLNSEEVCRFAGEHPGYQWRSLRPGHVQFWCSGLILWMS